MVVTPGLRHKRMGHSPQHWRRRSSGGHWILAAVLALGLLTALPQRGWCAAMGLAWGSGVGEVSQRLGCDLTIYERTDSGLIYTGEALRLGALPVSRLRAVISPDQGLQRLVYALRNQDSVEVLAGLRARYGPPVSTSHDDGSQEWMWMTQDDCIRALRIPGKDFLLTYRPVRLDLSEL